MLIKLSEIYGTDLDAVLYGQDRQLRDAKRIRVTAKVLLILLPALTAISAAFLWTANRFFAISEGQMSAEEKLVFAVRQRLVRAWEIADTLILLCALLGFFLLLILLVTGRGSVALKTKLKYAALLSAIILAAALLFGVTDPLFPVSNYIITPVLVIGRLAVFLAADLIIEYFQHRKRSH